VEKYLLKHFRLIRTIIAILIGMVLSVFLIYVVSKTPGYSIYQFFLGPLLTFSRFANILENAAPLIFCGVALSISFQARQFNIGAEGAFFLSAAVGTAFAVSTQMPIYLHIPLILGIAGITGALWGFIPGFMKAKWGASELVSSLMLNYVAYFLGLYLINYHFRDKTAGFLVSFRLAETALLPKIVPNTRIHLGVVLALLFALWGYYLLFHTKLGYEIRTTGFNKHYARYAGINAFKVVIMAQVLMGFVAGIGGMTEIMGIHERFRWQVSPGYGWDGVIVAIIGRSHPLLVVCAALFLSYLRVGGQVLNLQSDVPAELVMVIQSIIILLVTAEAFLFQWRYRLTLKEAANREVGNESIAP